jgi:NDP-sugar pyrophosphorylase family protein
VGILSIGDIQRAIIQNRSLETSITEVLRKNIRVAKQSDSFEAVKKMMLEYRMECCPVINESKEITEVFYWEDLFLDKKPQPLKKFQLPVVIMAGGFGTRLKPLTNVLPKPLIPIAETTIIEEIFNRFGNYGCSEFFISLNYKADLIEYYLNHQGLPYKMEFFREEKPMGTAGSLSLLRGKINETFFVSNCDILIEQDYSEILDFHHDSKNEITIVAALKHIKLPYGIIESGEMGQLKDLMEKPEFTYKINSGMYVLEPHLLDEIPQNQFFHITNLIDQIRSKNRKVGIFPVSENSWKDIGDWNEYLKNIQVSK